MSKPRSQSLDTVHKLAERAEHKAARQLEAQQHQLRQEQAQVDQIMDYHRDYISLIEQQKSLHVSELMAYRDFTQNLSRSITQMQLKVSRLEAVLSQSKEKWRLLRQRRLAIEDLITRAKAEENLALDKLEQKALDDLVTQQLHRRLQSEDDSA